MNNKQHEFALFVPNLSELLKHKESRIALTEPTLIHRLSHVIRIPVGEQVILFSNTLNATCTVVEYTKKQIFIEIIKRASNLPILPKLTLMLPLLKREALDEVVYAAQELGASSIIFVATEKSSRQTLSSSEWERIERVRIAAAEQSKNFFPCSFNNPQTIPTLAAFLQTQQININFTQAQKWYADPTGKSWQACSKEKQSSDFFVCIGPEADLTDREKELLQKAGFIFCTLGPTILRAQQAASILMGLVRVGL